MLSGPWALRDFLLWPPDEWACGEIRREPRKFSAEQALGQRGSDAPPIACSQLPQWPRTWELHTAGVEGNP